MRISIVVISKNEEKLLDTLNALEKHIQDEQKFSDTKIDITVVDASNGALHHIEECFPAVQWINFEPPIKVRVSIPHQRNCGIRATMGEIIVFVDAGCLPHEDWLRRLTAPLIDGSERITCGPSWIGNNLYSRESGEPVPDYVSEAPTVNLALTRALANEVGDFDENFEYGSDIDFTRRAVKLGAQIRYIADAVVEHDWGSFRRQFKRSRQYGAARIRLSRKYSDSFIAKARSEPVPVLYALFILGLPLTFQFRRYPLLLAIPLWRARKRPYPFRVVIIHLAEGIGGLQEIIKIGMDVLSSS